MVVPRLRPQTRGCQVGQPAFLTLSNIIKNQVLALEDDMTTFCHIHYEKLLDRGMNLAGNDIISLGRGGAHIFQTKCEIFLVPSSSCTDND